MADADDPRARRLHRCWTRRESCRGRPGRRRPVRPNMLAIAAWLGHSETPSSRPCRKHASASLALTGRRGAVLWARDGRGSGCAGLANWGRRLPRRDARRPGRAVRRDARASVCGSGAEPQVRTLDESRRTCSTRSGSPRRPRPRYRHRSWAERHRCWSWRGGTFRTRSPSTPRSSRAHGRAVIRHRPSRTPAVVAGRPATCSPVGAVTGDPATGSRGLRGCLPARPREPAPSDLVIRRDRHVGRPSVLQVPVPPRATSRSPAAAPLGGIR